MRETVKSSRYIYIIRLPLYAAAFFVCLCDAGRAQDYDYGDAFVSASISDARTLIPILASDTASSDVCGMIYNGLVKYDKDINIAGDLAERWEILDGGLAIIFHLRRNVRWHDGKPFTASDVEFTYRKLIDPSVKTPYSGDFQLVKSFEIIDEYTVKVTYAEPFAPALSSWGMSVMPRHLLEREDLNTTPCARRPVGTGPYKFKSWKTQNKIELVSNRDYFEHRPFIGRVVYRVIPDHAAIFLELQTEGIDSAGLTPLQFLRQTDTPFFRRWYRTFRLPGFGYTYLGYNLRNPKFQDARVRQALNCAVDKDEIIRIVLLGFGRVCTGPFIPDSWAFNAEVTPTAFDPARARILLAEAGWRDSDADGVLDKDGARFEFTLLVNQGNEERLKAAQIIQRRLKDTGVNVRIKVLEWSVLLAEHIDKRNFDAVIMGWSLGRDPDNYDIWHSSKTREGEFNFGGYRNDEVDRLLTEGRRTFVQDTRREYYHKIHEILYEDQPYMFLYVPENLSAVHRRFQGVVQAPIGIGYNFIDWRVPKPDQKYSAE